MRATSHQLEITQFRFQSQIVGSRVCLMKSVDTVSKLVFPIFTVQSIVGYILSSLSTSSQLLSLFKTLHWWSRVISASQFKHLDFSDDTLEGVNANGAGEGNFWTYGETRKGDRLIIWGVSGERWLLSNSFSGDLIHLHLFESLWAKGERFGGERTVGEGSLFGNWSIHCRPGQYWVSLKVKALYFSLSSLSKVTIALTVKRVSGVLKSTKRGQK